MLNKLFQYTAAAALMALICSNSYAEEASFPMHCYVTTGDFGKDFVISSHGEQFFLSYLVVDGTEQELVNLHPEEISDGYVSLKGFYRYHGTAYDFSARLEQSPRPGLWGVYLTRYLTDTERLETGKELIHGRAICQPLN